MPFSSTSVSVNPGDRVQVRYPTPSTWNTQVTVNVQIGTGSDPDGITFGTKIPDALPQSFSFTNQQGFTGAFNGTSSSGSTNTFQRNTTYYSQVIDLSDFEIPLPASISAVSNGPKNNNTNNTTAQFRIYRGGAFDSWRSSITANIATGTGGLQPGDKVQLRVTTPNWYVTSTLVTFVVGDETFGTNIGQPSTVLTRTWGITTRAQDQDIAQYSFTDRVDQKIPADGGSNYWNQSVSITGIDGDVVLRATSAGNVQISADNTNWSQSIGAQLVLNDTLYTRILNGPGYTTKTTGTLNVFAVGGDTYTRSGSSYENTTAGTYGSGSYQVTQNLGTVTDNWQSWTEVDRYPDPISASPIFTYGTKLALNGASPTAGFVPGNTYSVSGGSGNSMVVKLTTNGFNDLIIVDPGYGYNIGDNISISAGGETANLTVIEYEKVLVSADDTHNRAEPGFVYFADFTITGIGDEYTSGSYNDLESPYTNLANNNPSTAQNLVSTLNGTNVKMGAIIDGTGGFIRKNNTGSWVQQITVEENDVINLKLTASSTYEVTQTARVTIKGPPDGNPAIGNPTGGPSSPTYANKNVLMTLVTREERTVPYPFHATPKYLADPDTEQIAEVAIRGLDAPTTATITSGVGSLSIDQINWGSSVSILTNTQILYVRQNSSAFSGGLAQLSYRIGNAADISAGDAITDNFRVYTRQFNVLGDFITETWFGQGFTDYTEFIIPAFASEEFYLSLVGAGGGDGGGDVPNSSGGPGGAGNVFRCLVQIPVSAWPTDQAGQPDFKLRVYPADAGDNGASYVSGTGGGDGGFGYAYGGDGGNAGPGDSSGAGGGGGGASAVTFSNNVLIALAGGGGGGGGAGNDTATPLLIQYGNYDSNGQVSTSTINLNLPGDDAPDRTGQGAGPGGGGGGYDGSAGALINSYIEIVDGVTTTLQTSDLDATGGNGGGIYYNTTYVTPLGAAQANGQGAAAREEGAAYIEYSQQDIEPDEFSFSTTDGATIQQQVLSDIVQITGITGTVPVSVSSPGFTSDLRICTSSSAASCGSWESGTQIGNNQYVQIRATTGNQYFSTYTVGVTVGSVTSYWDINTGPPPDSEPNPFFIEDVLDVPINTDAISEEITISGITVPVTITATNGAEISVNGGAYVNGATGTTIENGETFTIRLTSSADYEDTVTTQVTVGTGDAVEWNVVTAAELDSQPDSYTWIFEVGADLLQTYESNTNLITGLETTADFIIESGSGDGDPAGLLPRIKKNGDLLDVGVTQTTIQNFDTLALVYTTTDIVGETRVFNTKLGLASATTGFYETPWSVVTAGQFGTDPSPFSFASAIASGPGVYAEAEDGGTVQVVTITGLANGISVGLYGTNGVQFNVNNTGYDVYTVGSQANVSNGSTFTVRLLSSEIPGFTRTAFIFAGSFSTSFSVQSPAAISDPISSQWYSSITPCKYIGNTFSGDQIRVNTKFDGLPVGSIMPVFQDALESDFWGTLNGKANSRFPSWVYCDGSYYDPEEYPLLFSVLEYEYGAKVVGSSTYFRVPDLRNRYVKGTGVIDGTSASSPGLAPEYRPTKQSGAPGNTRPGAFGGMWFVDTVGDPGVDELEQVVTPATGQPAQESEYFGIAQVTTSGYPDVTGLIEFITTGSAVCPVGLDPEKIYDVPLHFHDLISGVADPGRFKGKVNWGGNGGYGIDVTPQNANNLGSTTVAVFTSSGTFSLNLWGYATGDYDLDSDNLPGSTGCNDSGWWNGNTTNWANGTNPGYEGIETVGGYGSVTIKQTQMTPGSGSYSEINQYIDANNQPFPGAAGAFGGSNARKFFSTVDIPEKVVTVKSYNPVNKLKHNHYVSLTAIGDNSVYGYGNNETGGTGSTGLNSFSGGINSSVNLSFSALDVGIQVLPGTFTLQQTKQLIPVPEFSPQDKVPMVTPYVWTKWLIKAF